LILCVAHILITSQASRKTYIATARPKNTQRIQLEQTLLNGITLGDKDFFNFFRKDALAYRQLGLAHILTPSGLHFSCLMRLAKFFISPLLQWLQLPLSFLYIFGLFATGFFPNCMGLQRAALLKNFFSLVAIEKRYAFWGFLVVFFLEYIFGSYSLSPLSFCFSFVFWGVIFSFQTSAQVLKGFIFSQFFLAFEMGRGIYPLAPVANIFLTSIITPFLPFLFLSKLLFLKMVQMPALFFLKYFNHLVQFVFSLIHFVPKFSLSFFLLLVLFFLLFHKRGLACALALLTFFIPEIPNMPSQMRILADKTPPSPLVLYQSPIKKSSYTKNSIGIVFSQGRRCKLRPLNWSYDLRCHSPPRTTKR